MINHNLFEKIVTNNVIVNIGRYTITVVRLTSLCLVLIHIIQPHSTILTTNKIITAGRRASVGVPTVLMTLSITGSWVITSGK